MEVRLNVWSAFWKTEVILMCLVCFISTYSKKSLCAANTNLDGDVGVPKLRHQPNLDALHNRGDSQTVKETSQLTSTDYLDICPSLTECSDLGGSCIHCDYNNSCVYGELTKVTCTAKDYIDCIGERTFETHFICRYCYQTESWDYRCSPASNCKVNASPRQTVKVNCTVSEEILCLGRRTFFKNTFCNWTSGYRYTTALILSITLGGFGVDRFYLGYWREGLGKLFSFGGLGVWTIVDAILVGVGYITPADGSLYIF